MIEKTIFDYLSGHFSGSPEQIPVYMEIPKERPGRFVLIEKTGSSLEGHVYQSTFAIQSYDVSLYKAAALNQLVIAAMLGAVGLDEITRVDLNSDYNFTAAGEKQYRYQAVFDVTHY